MTALQLLDVDQIAPAVAGGTARTLAPGWSWHDVTVVHRWWRDVWVDTDDLAERVTLQLTDGRARHVTVDVTRADLGHALVDDVLVTAEAPGRTPRHAALQLSAALGVALDAVRAQLADEEG